jgi:hydroxyacylglutathione hydrolase
VILKTYVVGALKTNAYLVGCERTREAMLIDPGAEAARLLRGAKDEDLQIKRIVLTHFHFDHLLAAKEVRAKSAARLAIHEAEAELLANPPSLFRVFHPSIPRDVVADDLLRDGDHLHIGDLDVEVLHTPGHSPGGISLWIATERVSFSGDALFREGLGRTDFPGCDHEALIRSIRDKLFSLPDETRVYPGHGPATTVGHERRHNPWLT